MAQTRLIEKHIKHAQIQFLPLYIFDLNSAISALILLLVVLEFE